MRWVKRRGSRFRSSLDSFFGSTGTPPLAPPHRVFTQVLLQVIVAATPRPSSSSATLAVGARLVGGWGPPGRGVGENPDNASAGTVWLGAGDGHKGEAGCVRAHGGGEGGPRRIRGPGALRDDKGTAAGVEPGAGGE